MITVFEDSHSGGTTKTDWEIIFIEATKQDAINIFSHKFGQSPLWEYCGCCGANYFVNEFGNIDEAIKEYKSHIERGEAIFIRAIDIIPLEREEY